MRPSLLAGIAVLLAACTGAASSTDPSVHFRLTNAGTEPMQCKIIFGHWVDRDLGLLAPGGTTAFAAQQQRDGALYIERDDGQRRMMIENIFCARPNDWQASVGQVDLATVRAARPAAVDVSCILQSGGHVACRKPAVL